MIISNIYINGKNVSEKELKSLTVINKDVSTILKTASKRTSDKTKNDKRDVIVT